MKKLWLICLAGAFTLSAAETLNVSRDGDNVLIRTGFPGGYTLEQTGWAQGPNRQFNFKHVMLSKENGKPFLIKTDIEISNPVFSGVTVTYDAAMVNPNGTVGALVERDHVDFQGILAPYDLAYYSNSSPDYLGIGADGRLRWADGSLSTGLMRGFRAFFHVKDAGQAGSPVRRGMNAQFVDGGHRVPTAVDNTATRQPQVQKVIRDGEVLIIRDGKQYNALGAEVK